LAQALSSDTQIVIPLFPLARPQRGLWSDAWSRMRRGTNARVGMAVILVFVIIALTIEFVNPYNPRTDGDLVNRLHAPSDAHLFGTDDQGRDILVRVLHGAPISLQVGLVSVALALVLGSTLGLSSGYLGGWMETISMRAMDVMLSFPSILLAIGIVAARGPGLGNTMLAIGIVNIPVYARIARSVTLSIKEQEYITAARAIGVQSSRMISRHVLPNSLSSIIVQGTLSIATAILEAAGLGFLGLGAQPPTPEWGAMLGDGYKFLTIGAWWVLLFPGLAIMLTVLGFNLLGDGLRDALDPRLRP
jgi:peptide/nickel transport system permease protein